MVHTTPQVHVNRFLFRNQTRRARSSHDDHGNERVGPCGVLLHSGSSFVPHGAEQGGRAELLHRLQQQRFASH